MKRHLLHKKRLCCAVANDIVLTDEIKQYVLDNRVYRIPPAPTPPPAPTYNQIINNNNMINNFLSGIDPIKKINEYVAWKGINMQNFDTKVEFLYEDKRNRLEQGKGYHKYGRNEIIEVLGESTRFDSRRLEQCNVFFEDANNLAIYENQQWNSLPVDLGIERVVETIKTYLWDAYECFLIRKMENTRDYTVFERDEFKKLLCEYYCFLASVGVSPYVIERANNTILYNADDDRYYEDVNYSNIDGYNLSDKYMTLFNKCKADMSKSDSHQWRSSLINCLRGTSKKNLSDVNNQMSALFEMHPDFKEHAVDHLRLGGS
jgi:hypothetical protein